MTEQFKLPLLQIKRTRNCPHYKKMYEDKCKSLRIERRWTFLFIAFSFTMALMLIIK